MNNIIKLHFMPVIKLRINKQRSENIYHCHRWTSFQIPCAYPTCVRIRKKEEGRKEGREEEREKRNYIVKSTRNKTLVVFGREYEAHIRKSWNSMKHER